MAAGEPGPAFFLGTGGKRPAIYGVGRDGAATLLAPSEAGQSFYSVAVSPGGNRLAAGVRNSAAGDRYGRVFAWARRPDGSVETARPLLSCFQPTSVSAVDMPTDETIVSGGIDGVVRWWRLDRPEREAGSLPVHAGQVLALRALSDSLVASMGADGYLRLVDVSRGGCTWQCPPTGRPAVVPGLLGLAAAPEAGLVVSHHPCGSVLVVNVGGPEVRVAPLALPGGPAAAMTLAGDRVVVADLNALMLRVLPLTPGRAPVATRVEKPVLALVALDVGRVVVVYRDGSAAIWRLDPAPSVERWLEVPDVRCASGPPRSAQLKEARQAGEGRRNQLLARAREVAAAGQIDSLEAMSDELAAEGLGLEALVLLSETCAVQGRPLWALRARLQLVAAVPKAPWAGVHWFTLGELLEKLNEQDRAREAFATALALDPGIAGAHEGVERCRGFARADNLAAGVVREDLPAAIPAVRAEVEKLATLGVRWPWRVTVLVEEFVLRGPVTVDALAARLEKMGQAWAREDAEVRGREALSKLSWLVRRPEAPGLAGLEWAVEPVRRDGRFLLVHRLLLAPPADGVKTPEEAAALVARLAVAAEGAEARSWFDSVRAPANSHAAFCAERARMNRDEED